MTSISLDPRKKRIPSPDALRAGMTPNVAESAGPTPEGAIGGGEALDASRNLVETGSATPTAVPESYGEVTGTGIALTGEPVGTPAPTPWESTGGTTYAGGAGEAGTGGDATGELAPYQSVDDEFEKYLRSILEGEGDTAEQERLMQEQSDRLLGMNLLDQRARMGEAGFGMSGAEASIENQARSDAARQLGLDIYDVREREQDQKLAAVGQLMGIDIDMQRLADDQEYRQMLLDAYQSIMGGQPDAPPEDEAPDGGGIDLPDLPDGLETTKDRAIDFADDKTGGGATAFLDYNGDGEVNTDDLLSVRSQESWDALWKYLQGQGS